MSTDMTCVVTLNWNGKDDTLACLASLEEMEPRATRIILVDNASTDGTSQAVAERFPQVQMLVNDENLGFARGVNVGLRAALEAGAAYILMVNNDTLVAPDLLGVLMAAVNEEETIGAAAPKITYADPPDRIWYAGAFRRRWLPGFSFPGYGKQDAARYSRTRDVDYFTGCGVLLRGDVLGQVGLFDEISFFMYHEDLDLSERIRQAGYRIVYVPQARMWHKESASTAPMSAQNGTTWRFMLCRSIYGTTAGRGHRWSYMRCT